MTKEREAKVKKRGPMIGSAAGKLILSGEHAVVYGQPAVAIGLPSGLSAQLTLNTSASSSPLMISSASLTTALGDDERHALKRALTCAVRWMAEQGYPLNDHYILSLSGSLPFKVGMGSSAALSVATLRALARACDHGHWSDEQLYQGAMEMEKVFHAHPSGLDHFVAIHGGALKYQRTNSEPLHQSIRVGAPLTLALTWFPRQGSTSDVVQSVAQRRTQDSKRYEILFKEIGIIAHEIERLLPLGSIGEIGSLLDQNHRLLQEIRVSTHALDETCEYLRSRGALGAKLSGAGHGGVCFALFPEEEMAAQALDQLATPHWLITVPAT